MKRHFFSNPIGKTKENKDNSKKTSHSFTFWIHSERKEITFHVELQYSACSSLLPHTLTSLYQLIFSDPRNKRVDSP
jgi:hypothetical protein